MSKVILRHSNLSTTQRYLGKISDSEATRWIENLYGSKRLMGKGALATLFPVPRILNIRFGTLEDFDVRFFNDEEVSWISHGLGGITAS